MDTPPPSCLASDVPTMLGFSLLPRPAMPASILPNTLTHCLGDELFHTLSPSLPSVVRTLCSHPYNVAC